MKSVSEDVCWDQETAFRRDRDVHEVAKLVDRKMIHAVVSLVPLLVIVFDHTRKSGDKHDLTISIEVSGKPWLVDILESRRAWVEAEERKAS